MARKTVLFRLISFLFPVLFLQAAEPPELLFFYEQGCPECARVRNFLDKRIVPHYRITVRAFDIHEPGMAELLLKLAEAYDSEAVLNQGVPAVLIGRKVFQGGNRVVFRDIEQAVRSAVRTHPPSPLAGLKRKNEGASPEKNLTLPAVLSAAAVDSVNPCACTVLILLLGTILISSGRRKKNVLMAGFAFTSACFLSYFLMGLGLFSAFRASGLLTFIFGTSAFLSVILGMYNLWESFVPTEKRRSLFPPSWQPRLKKLVSGITSVPGAFFTGVLISLFLLPCTSGPYLVIIGMLSRTSTRPLALLYLYLYNIVFILPFILITLAVGLGLTTTARIDSWRRKNQAVFHAVTGVVLLLLGAVLAGYLFSDKW